MRGLNGETITDCTSGLARDLPSSHRENHRHEHPPAAPFATSPKPIVIATNDAHGVRHGRWLASRASNAGEALDTVQSPAL